MRLQHQQAGSIGIGIHESAHMLCAGSWEQDSALPPAPPPPQCVVSFLFCSLFALSRPHPRDAPLPPSPCCRPRLEAGITKAHTRARSGTPHGRRRQGFTVADVISS